MEAKSCWGKDFFQISWSGLPRAATHCCLFGWHSSAVHLKARRHKPPAYTHQCSLEPVQLIVMLFPTYNPICHVLLVCKGCCRICCSQQLHHRGGTMWLDKEDNWIMDALLLLWSLPLLLIVPLQRGWFLWFVYDYKGTDPEVKNGIIFWVGCDVA